MLTQNPANVANLQGRTRLRNSTVWIPLDWGGIMQPLAKEAAVLASLGRPFIASYMDETDELFAVKEYQRDRLSQVEQDKVTQDGRIADADAASKRRVLAFKLAGEQYVQAARLYDAEVRAYIMAAKEYAAEVEREQIKLEELRAIYGVRKAETRLQEVNAEVYYEYIKRMETQVDVAKAQLDVAKAQVRAVTTEISAEEAKLEVIETELKQAMAVAEKATLQADIAMIYADIVVRGLSKVKLGVEKSEIQAGYGWIAQKLSDLLAIWNVRTRTENLKTESQQEVFAEVTRLLAAEEAGEDLRRLELSVGQDVLSHEAEATYEEIDKEAELTASKLTAREALESAKGAHEDDMTTATTAAKKITNAAQQALNRKRETLSQQTQYMDLYISK